MENFGKVTARTIATISKIDQSIERLAGGTTSVTAVGGMSTKIQAARMVMRAGIPMLIASGKKKDVLGRLLKGENEGTAFVPQPNKLAGRKRWLAFFHHPKGTLIVDEGARKALRENGRSLLLPGVSRCEGSIAPGDVVSICDLNGTEFARGICRYSSMEIVARQRSKAEVVHRDDLVIL
jgi:glutamate 5-kinase